MKVLLVGAGKGGTGKTTMSSLIATHLTSQYNVGLLDTDLGCPSVAKMFGIGDYQFKFEPEGGMIPALFEGIGDERTLKVFSVGADIPDDQFVAWDGQQLTGMLRDHFDSIAWGDLDVLVVDLPPGTSDNVQLPMELYGNATVVPVTLNTELACTDTQRFIQLAKSKDMTINDLIVNMSDVYDNTEGIVFYEALGINKVITINFNKLYTMNSAGLSMLDAPDDNLIEMCLRLI